MNKILETLKSIFKSRNSSLDRFLEENEVDQGNLIGTFTKYIELPGAVGSFSEEATQNYDQALETLKEFLNDVSKVYLLGFSKKYKAPFFQIDRAKEGGAITLLMIEDNENTIMIQKEVNNEIILKAFNLFWSKNADKSVF